MGEKVTESEIFPDLTAFRASKRRLKNLDLLLVRGQRRPRPDLPTDRTEIGLMNNMESNLGVELTESVVIQVKSQRFGNRIDSVIFLIVRV